MNQGTNWVFESAKLAQYSAGVLTGTANSYTIVYIRAIAALESKTSKDEVSRLVQTVCSEFSISNFGWVCTDLFC